MIVCTATGLCTLLNVVVVVGQDPFPLYSLLDQHDGVSSSHGSYTVGLSSCTGRGDFSWGLALPSEYDELTHEYSN